MDVQINAALNGIKNLRASVSNIFETAITTDGNFLPQKELEEAISAVTQNFKETETCINNLNPPSVFTLGNTSYLNYETDLEKQNMYNELVNGYKWYEKTHQYSAIASTLLQHNSLKRSYYSTSNKRRRIMTGAHAVMPKQVDQLIGTLHIQNMQMKIYRPFATNAFIHINLNRVLKAAIILRGLMIEWVTVKGFNESLDNVDDHWSESRYEVFRRIQKAAHSAMLHFYSPTFAELAIRSFITWFASYQTLFSEPCKNCGNFLTPTTFLPPTYRDVRSLIALHEECL